LAKEIIEADLNIKLVAELSEKIRAAAISTTIKNMRKI
jgi:hypothetical protein